MQNLVLLLRGIILEEVERWSAQSNTTINQFSCFGKWGRQISGNGALRVVYLMLLQRLSCFKTEIRERRPTGFDDFWDSAAGARRERYNSLPVSAAITSYCLPSSLHILSTSRFPLKLENVLPPLAFCWAYWVRYESLEGCFRIDHLCSLHMRLIYPPSGAYAVCQGPGRYISVLLAVDQKKKEEKKRDKYPPFCCLLTDRLMRQFKDLENRDGDSRAVSDTELMKCNE